MTISVKDASPRTVTQVLLKATPGRPPIDFLTNS